ncbi:hypothetical protein GJ654_18890 [Rhodoblastus acidophilus]|uniref:Uncharacterized protein n=1 Tax=Rhodoblastus acidophilus TaxID=1074 RepID=A0A6N8DV69_RHOAC|nr:hypothetical protein [Rhodoblastus acidophilus]MCW2276396.1 hypothetical protein [Rhodoblastus acidophilus]MTV33051.1 hypothetical protein [Rhodoblastus acidophilus]
MATAPQSYQFTDGAGATKTGQTPPLGYQAGANAISVAIASDQPAIPVLQSGSWSVAVSNWPATQAVSASSLPLPAGAATAANQPSLNGDGGALAHVTNWSATQAISASSAIPVSGTFWQATQPVSLASLPALATGSNVIGGVTISGTPSVSVSESVAVTGTFWQATQPISAATLPLPTGAATSAKQDDLKAAIAGMSIPVHDYIGLGYTGGNVTTVTYKTGGASGTTVATLTLAYDGSNNLTSITKA